MKLDEIGYAAEIPAAYGSGLGAADTHEKQILYLQAWEALAGDALDAATTMLPSDFEAFRFGLARERKGTFADKWAAILMPEAMLRVSIFADHFKVPWGVAWHRLRDTGRVAMKNGRAEVNEP